MAVAGRPLGYLPHTSLLNVSHHYNLSPITFETACRSWKNESQIVLAIAGDSMSVHFGKEYFGQKF